MKKPQWLTEGLFRGAIGVFLLVGLVFRAYGSGAPPKIDVQPLGISVLSGGSAAFVIVTRWSATPLSFKLVHNSGKTEVENVSVVSVVLPLVSVITTITIPQVSDKDAGDYRVIVTNGGGSATSDKATLIVLTKPLDPVLNLLASGMTTNGFHLQLSGPSGASYVIMASSNMVDWTPISTNSAPTGTVSFTDTNAVNLGFRYYKAVAQ